VPLTDAAPPHTGLPGPELPGLVLGGATALPLLVGSGVTPDNVATILGRVDGVIVASSLKRDGDWWNEVEVVRVRALVDAANS